METPMTTDMNAKLDTLEAEMQETFATLKDEGHPKAMMAGVILVFGLMWKAIRLIADERA
jgi:hypothetical protein